MKKYNTHIYTHFSVLVYTYVLLRTFVWTKLTKVFKLTLIHINDEYNIEHSFGLN